MRRGKMRSGRKSRRGKRWTGAAGAPARAAPVRQVQDLAGVYQAEAFEQERRTRKSRKRRRPHGGRANGTRKSRRRPMSTDRRIGLEIGLSQGGAEWDAPGRRRRAPPRRGRADSQAFARALKGADGESLDAARMSAPLTPFGLFGPAPPQAPPPRMPRPGWRNRAWRPVACWCPTRAEAARGQGRTGRGLHGRGERIGVRGRRRAGGAVPLRERARAARVSALAQGLADGLAASLRRLVRINLQDRDGADVHPGQWLADGSAP